MISNKEFKRRKNNWLGGKNIVTIQQRKLSQEAKRIKKEMNLPWSCCKWAAKKRLRGVK